MVEAIICSDCGRRAEYNNLLGYYYCKKCDSHITKISEVNRNNMVENLNELDLNIFNNEFGMIKNKSKRNERLQKKKQFKK